MNILIHPFYSQQDKVTGEFLVDKCCVVKICDFLAKSLVEAGHKVAVTVPQGADEKGLFKECFLWRLPIPNNNLEQRTWQDIESWKTFLLPDDYEGPCDLIISHHELQTPFLRAFFPKAKIIQFNHLMPLEENLWMKHAQVGSWKTADLVVFLSIQLAYYAKTLVGNHGQGLSTRVWPMAYSEDEAISYLPTRADPGPERDIDILFCQRCSASNYTHHIEFLRALKILEERGWKGKVVFTDPTHFLESYSLREEKELNGRSVKIEFANADTKEQYWGLLSRSKRAIAMMEHDLHGGVAVREAIRAGAIPILLRTAAYLNIVEPRLPDLCYIDEPTTDEILKGILAINDEEYFKYLRPSLIESIKKQSMERASNIMMEDIARLMRG